MKKLLWIGLLCALLALTACGTEKAPQPDVPDTGASAAGTAAEAQSESLIFAEELQTTEEAASETVPAETAAQTQTTQDSTPVRVQVREAKKNDPALASAKTYTAIDDDPSVQLLFTAEGTPRDFRFLAIEFTDVGSGGEFLFNCKTLLEIPSDVLRTGAAVSTVFYGDIPNNGYSYVDENGETQYYSIAFSGEDGSLITEPFTPVEN